ncbi:transcriptional regulator, TetR family [Nannocystis exedens]|uniref:Transcriptional regulator, TetR family n=1 Tax=Nannocystis exedens TaxID=54 RepID=A0A1I2GI12_9BACT|nr:TetR/AcrR family transcriptional regulator [Nannocystis exedens]PCC73587.1 TetR family transcriptional regulator [Nannocystis exedens]SFF17504.1 transcriptional regulator, TetR family [Nannocystis exedens]
MASRSPGTPSRRSATARRAILEAARALVLEVGYARLTVEGIAGKAGVGKQTIYRWWPSKGAVVFEAFLSGGGAGGSSTELPDSGDVERDLKTVLRATVEELLEPSFDAALRGMTAEIQSDTELAKQLVEVLLGPQMKATVRRLESAQRVKQIRRGVDLDVAAELLFGPVFHRWLLRTRPLDRAFADEVVRLTLRALRPAPKEGGRRAPVGRRKRSSDRS